jgi:dipeptidyl aminopeptidase/acylaminoacyl peptidase
VLPLNGSVFRRLSNSPLGSLDEVAPRWSPDGHFIFVTAGGHLWRVSTVSAEAVELASKSGIEIAALVGKFDQPTAWTTDKGSSIWAVGLRRNTHQFGVLCINALSGRLNHETQLPGGVEGGSSIDATAFGNRIAFVASDQRHPADLWVYSTGDRSSRQFGHMNPELERYELGEAKVIDFRSADGKELRASLLLPPGYRTVQRLPTIVWVYGGENGSDAARTFGLVAGGNPMFDMHILATRGYAVLFPDAPLNQGTLVKDLLQTVMPGIDAAIAQGYVDPDRMAVMGNSFGAYSALLLISHTDRFKAALVSGSVIHPDLLAGYLEMDDDGSPTWIGYFEQGQGGMGGSPWQYRARYLENSPIYDFDKIKTPLLMAQGAEDGRLLGGDATFIALRRLGKDVEYRIYEGEGHVLQRKENVRDFWLRQLDFLKSHVSN